MTTLAYNTPNVQDFDLNQNEGKNPSFLLKIIKEHTNLFKLFSFITAEYKYLIFAYKKDIEKMRLSNLILEKEVRKRREKLC